MGGSTRREKGRCPAAGALFAFSAVAVWPSSGRDSSRAARAPHQTRRKCRSDRVRDLSPSSQSPQRYGMPAVTILTAKSDKTGLRLRMRDQPRRITRFGQAHSDIFSKWWSDLLVAVQVSKETSCRDVAVGELNRVVGGLRGNVVRTGDRVKTPSGKPAGRSSVAAGAVALRLCSASFSRSVRPGTSDVAAMLPRSRRGGVGVPRISSGSVAARTGWSQRAGRRR